MNFIKHLKEALLLRLRSNLEPEYYNLEIKLTLEPQNITLKELRLIFKAAGIKSITIDNTTINI